MKMKLRLNWQKIIIFLLICTGLVFLTRSFWMSLGIVMLLFVVDALIANYEYRRKTKKFFDDLRQEHEQDATTH